MTPGTNLTEKQIQGLIGCAQDAGLKLRTFTLWRLALSVEANKDNTKDSVDNTDLIIAERYGNVFWLSIQSTCIV